MARFLTMKERLEWERMGRAPQVITDLNLDNCRSYVIDGLTNEYTALNTLSINYVLLHSFGDLPQLPSLTILSAHHNLIARNLHFLAERCPNLREVDFSYNHIEHVEALCPLRNLEKLEVLNLEHNPVNRPDFRSYIFDLLPTVKVLSGYMRPNAVSNVTTCKDIRIKGESDDGDCAPVPSDVAAYIEIGSEGERDDTDCVPVPSDVAAYIEIGSQGESDDTDCVPVPSPVPAYIESRSNSSDSSDDDDKNADPDFQLYKIRRKQKGNTRKQFGRKILTKLSSNVIVVTDDEAPGTSSSSMRNKKALKRSAEPVTKTTKRAFK